MIISPPITIKYNIEEDLFGYAAMNTKIYKDVFEVIKSIQHEFENIDRGLNSNPTWRGEFYRDLLFHKTEKFCPTTMPDGTTRLVPDNQRMFLYRGETKDHPHCISRLYRKNPSEMEIFLARLHTVEFEMVLRHHPAVQDIIEDGLYVHFPCLAQHYGIKTELLDLTSDYWTAAFFAVCEPNASDDSYKPISNLNDKYGVMYKSLILALQGANMGESKLDIIGLQPFLRPGLQKAYSYKIGEKENLPAHKMIFKHSEVVSEEIFEMFEGGNRILPKDPIHTKAVEIIKGDNFSSTAFQEVLNRYPFNKDRLYYLNELEHRNVHIINEQTYNFSTKQIELFKEEWHRENNKFYQQISPPRMTF